ncbi:MAG: hypothetical protein HC890_18785 [Chloroflexaceae bacterium]|nr:hypothetical protein [Chloroflexaceae bacterium]
MMTLTWLCEFSRINCVAICAFLVPTLLLATVQTLLLLVWSQSLWRLRGFAIASCLVALTLFSHVATWFIIGVITPVTFILAGLGGTCLAINGFALGFQQFPPWREVLRSQLRGFVLVP